MSYYTKFGTLLIDSSDKTQPVNLSRYATLDQLRNEINNLLNITSVDPNEVVVCQDRRGKLKTSNIQLYLYEILVRLPIISILSITKVRYKIRVDQ